MFGPAISVCGTDDWLGEWTFALPQGSMTDAPVAWAHLIARQGLKTVGVVIEQSLIGESYSRYFRKACEAEGLTIIGEHKIAQTAQDVSAAIGKLHEARPDALVHRGFGFGVVHVNPALAALGWDPPGTRLSFGKWTRRGWMGAGYLVARRLDPDSKSSHLVARFGAV